VLPLIFTQPQIWCYVPMEIYEEAKQIIFKDNPKYAGLIERIDRYHYQVQALQHEILLKTASEVKTAVRAGYNRPLYGLTKGANVHSDDKVDTAFASFGATCAPLNTRFPVNYQQKVPSEYNYVSPDRMIDASTCTIPELTWFGKNQPHRGELFYNGWYEWFLSTTGGYTVHDNWQYPQYSEHQGNDQYIPLDVKPGHPAKDSLRDAVTAAALWMLKVWRRIAVLPFFWMNIVNLGV